jgi:hypothetical protein
MIRSDAAPFEDPLDLILQKNPQCTTVVAWRKPVRITVILFAAVLLAQAPDPKPVRLFNGVDLKGWTHYLWDSKANAQDTTTPMSAVWTVKNGILYCTGKPTGYIRTLEEYENYRLAVEWRWPEGTTRGNNGVLIHTTTPNALGQWPKSIEVQLAFGNAGDFWVIGTELMVTDVEKRRQGRRHLNLTDNSEKPAGEWNRMEIEARGKEIKVWVNGHLVNHATQVSQTKGAISLQSEGAPVEFRSVVLTPLQ